MKYDAFISYKHGPLDSFIASNLQKILENYKIPESIQKSSGKKKINRIFRDKEELAAAYDLNEMLQDALIQSEYLILICTPESKNSPWVQQELDFFLKYHDSNKVLAVLAKGEPAEAFPDLLLYKKEVRINVSGEEEIIHLPVEPLACDVRSTPSSPKILKKKLYEESLRLLAPMLHCSYDQLKQRHREYKLQRNIKIIGMLALFAILFAFYAFRQSYKIKEQFQKALENQVRYLSSISLELFHSGDRTTALQTALAIQSEQPSDFIVPEQLYALNTALYSYKTPDRLIYQPYAIGEIDGGHSFGEISPEGSYFISIDEYGQANFLHGENGSSLYKITPNDLDLPTEKFKAGIPLSEDKALLLTSYAFITVDVPSLKSENIIHLDSNGYYSSIYDYDSYNNHFAIVAGTTLHIYDLNSGTLLQQKTILSDDGFDSISITDISFSETGNKIAIGFDNTSSQEKFPGLIVFSLDNGQHTPLSDTAVEEIHFIDDTYMSVIEYKPVNSNIDTSSFTDSKNTEYRLKIYNSDTGNSVFTSDKETVLNWGHTSGIHITKISLNGTAVRCLVSYVNGKLYLLNLDTNEIIQEMTYDNTICGIGQYDSSRFFVGLSDGSVQILSVNSLNKQKMSILDCELFSFYYSKKYQSIIQITEQGICYSVSKGDSAFAAMNSTLLPLNNFKIQNITYHQTSDSVYRCAEYGSFLMATNGIEVSKSGTSQCCYQFSTESSDQAIYNIYIGEKNHIPVLCYSVTDEISDSAKFYMINLENSTLLMEEDLSIYPTLYFDYSSIHYSSTLDYFVVKRKSGGAVIFTIQEDKLEPASIALRRDLRLNDLLITGDGRFIILIPDNIQSDKSSIYIYDTKESSYVATPLPLTFDGILKTVSGKSSSLIALCKGDRTIEIIDCSNGASLCTIPTQHYQQFDFSFFDEDKYLITCIDNIITMWDVSTGNALMQYSMDKNETELGSYIKTDSSGTYFAIKDSSFTMHHTTGINAETLSIFYVDTNQQFYPYAQVDYGYASFVGNEISVRSLTASTLYYSTFYDFDYLKTQAEDFLNGKQLTDTQKKQYFIYQ